MTEAELIHGVKTYLRRAAACTVDAEKNQRAAGKLLAKLKANKPNDQAWPGYVRKHFDLSRERADELIRIAVGTTTVAKTRERKRASVRKSRAKSVLRSTGSNGKATPVTCDFDPEHDKEDEWMTDEDIRSNAFRWQTEEAVRLAEQCALLRRGTSPSEITPERIKKIVKVIEAWQKLHRQLEGTYHGTIKKEEHRQALH